MKNALSQMATNLDSARRKRQSWQKIVSVLAAIVVFCTTYALILPAITMEKETICGVEEHEHSEECYETHITYSMQCVSQLSGQTVVHSHSEICYDADGNLICTLPEVMVHSHDETCYDAEGNLICTLPEVLVHSHDEACYETNRNLICTLPEITIHAHDDACYDTEGSLICTISECVEHQHDDTCYDAEGNLICTLPEVIAHVHEDACYEIQEGLVCQIPEVIEHIHTEECLLQEESEPILVCEIPVHIHADACYQEMESEETSGYLCASGEHTHGETCYDAEGTLTCTIPEHTHEAACLVADLDMNADVETQEQWEATFADVVKTGNLPTDVLAIAETQLGYQESTKNVVLIEGELKGYTRYGAWSGDAYGDWDTMFVSFCLNYAGVENFPLKSDSAELLSAVQEAGLCRTPDNYTPKSGDVIFFGSVASEDGTIEAKRTGLVVEVIPETEETSAQIKTIEGNSDNKVQYVTYEMADSSIVAYGKVASGEVLMLSYQGADYNVTVKFDQNANLPLDVELDVREIEAGTEEYDTYYQQSVQTLFGQSAVKTEEDLNVSFARFFDISFVVNGEKVEPEAPVEVQIRYDESIEIAENNEGVAVHFAEDGIEVLETEVSQSQPEQTDTFEFTQNSFSVTGTVVTYAARATGYTTVDPNSLDSSGNTQYVVYTKYGDKYYAVSGVSNAAPVEITVVDGVITSDVNNNLLWTFTYDGSVNTHIIKNVGSGRYMHSYYNSARDYSITTSGAYSSQLLIGGSGQDITFSVKSNSNYSYMASATAFGVTQTATQAAQFYIAALPQTTCHVWLDGTNGGLMGLYGSDNTYYAVTSGNTFTLPTTWKSPSKYAYKLNGWYDIVSHIYYPAGADVTITQNTVFYADWIAETYDVGQDNEHVVDSLDTNDFITTYVFDYNSLFNAQSLTHLGSISANSHTESWSMVNSGLVPYNNVNTLEFAFLDYDSNGDISYATGRDTSNTNQSIITSGIIGDVASVSGGKDLLDILFNPTTSIIGKTYVGTGNYLYQYMDATTDNYDGHDGYYYFHSKLNAASYNQTAQRFYLYDYLERTSDSEKDGGAGEYSDFLPFNSLYANHQNMDIETYTDPDTGKTGYQYDAKADGQGSEYENAGTNYWFGIRSDIEFYLPNDSGTQDTYGNYGNISTKGQHMVFEFHGDDDVWVFVDGQLMLDVGGVHGIEYGEIDFSTGKVTTYDADNNEVSKTFAEILGTGNNIKEGTHTMTFYYMERGSSQSNCSIYFNIAPRYDLEIRKEDVYTAEALDGTEFTIYTDEACTKPAELWASKVAHDAGEASISTITVENGVASCWGLSAGKTYYIKETKAPDGYPSTDDMIRITLNNRGTATIETTTLHGTDGIATEGYAVIEQDVNDTLKLVCLLVTNQTDQDTTKVRVQKTWDENSVDIPESITVYLTVNGKRVGRTATLTESNGWAYTWTGLPKYEADGLTEIIYDVEEVLVSGYMTTQADSITVEDRVDWIKTDAMEDNITYLLMNSGRALSYNGQSFYWESDIDYAMSDSGLASQWTVTTNQYGFRLTNGNGYSITYANGNFAANTSTSETLNEVLYFANGQLMAQQNDIYYYFGDGGTALSSDGINFTLYRKEVLTGRLVNIVNTPVEKENWTHVEVNKVWNDELDHSNDSVTIHLFADGKDTGRTVVLNADNNWRGSFTGLPYYQEDETTAVVYTIEEAFVDDYEASYSTPQTISREQFDVWNVVTDFATETNGIYRFTSGSYSLACDSSGQLIAKANDLTDTYQQWQVHTSGNNTILRNVGKDVYLVASTSSVYTTESVNSASAVVIVNEKLMIGNRYIVLSASGVSTSSQVNNGTEFTITLKGTASGKPGTSFTVTNTVAQYELPSTGGFGIHFVTLGGLLVLAAAFMYSQILRKRSIKRNYK